MCRRQLMLLITEKFLLLVDLVKKINKKEDNKDEKDCSSSIYYFLPLSSSLFELGQAASTLIAPSFSRGAEVVVNGNNNFGRSRGPLSSS